MISSDFDPNPNPLYVLFRRFLDCLIVVVDILFQDDIVKEINEPNSRWKAVFCDRFANTTVSSFFIHQHICVLIDSELLSFYDEESNAYNCS